MGHISQAHQAIKDLKVPDLTAWQKTLESVREEATLAMQHAQESWIKLTNYKVGLEGTNLHTTHPTKKLGPKQYGPFKVWEVVGHTNFHLELPPHWRIHNVFYAKLLYLYKETEEHRENFTETPPDLFNGKLEWEVEQILDMRTWWSGKQYLICWKGYSSAHNSWELWENINAPLLMVEFENRKSAQDKKGTQKGERVQKEGPKKGGRTIHSQAIYLDKNNMCNQTSPTPARSISPNWDLIPSPPSSLSSNSWAALLRSQRLAGTASIAVDGFGMD